MADLPHTQLQVRSGPQTGRVITIDTPNFVIGRGSTCNLIVPDKAISRQHAQIGYQNGVFYLQDLQSMAGTLLNGLKITVAPLHSGDVIAIRGLELEFRSALDMGSQAAYSGSAAYGQMGATSPKLPAFVLYLVGLALLIAASAAIAWALTGGDSATTTLSPPPTSTPETTPEVNIPGDKYHCSIFPIGAKLYS